MFYVFVQFLVLERCLCAPWYQTVDPGSWVFAARPRAHLGRLADLEQVEPVGVPMVDDVGQLAPLLLSGPRHGESGEEKNPILDRCRTEEIVVSFLSSNFKSFPGGLSGGSVSVDAALLLRREWSSLTRLTRFSRIGSSRQFIRADSCIHIIRLFPRPLHQQEL